MDCVPKPKRSTKQKLSDRAGKARDGMKRAKDGVRNKTDKVVSEVKSGVYAVKNPTKTSNMLNAVRRRGPVSGEAFGFKK